MRFDLRVERNLIQYSKLLALILPTIIPISTEIVSFSPGPLSSFPSLVTYLKLFIYLLEVLPSELHFIYLFIRCTFFTYIFNYYKLLLPCKFFLSFKVNFILLIPFAELYESSLLQFYSSKNSYKNIDCIGHIRGSTNLGVHQTSNSSSIRHFSIVSPSRSSYGHKDLENLTPLTIGASRGEQPSILNILSTRLM